MNPENSIETTGESVEEAIGKGLAALNARPMEVIIEVLEEPVQGVFGLESRPARVRVQRLAPPAPPPPVAPPPIEKPHESTPPRTERTPERPASGREERTTSERGAPGERRGRERAAAEQRGDERPQRQSYDRPALTHSEGDDDAPAYMDVSENDDALPFADTADEVPEMEHDEEVSVSRAVLNELLGRMDMRCMIVVRRAQPDTQNGTAPWILDIYASNASHLIGRRGETLAALQYLTRLIASRELQRRSDVIVDVESYKSRRAKTLYTLAQRMAEEAMSRNQIVALEPMPPHERRIIHLALRASPDVETRSVGEGQGRKVTIVPKALI